VSLVRILRSDQLPFLGRSRGDTQFMAFVIATGKPQAWYAVFHTFDLDGHHEKTLAYCGGTGASGERRAGEQQAQWLRELSTMLLGPVEIEPFDVVVEGVRFGLVPDPGGHRLLPNDLVV
jgi:hypothetical protein